MAISERVKSFAKQKAIELKVELERRRQIKIEERKRFREAYQKARIAAVIRDAKRRGRESVKPDPLIYRRTFDKTPIDAVGNMNAALFGMSPKNGKKRRGYPII